MIKLIYYLQFNYLDKLFILIIIEIKILYKNLISIKFIFIIIKKNFNSI